jgi:hypothetical protein
MSREEFTRAGEAADVGFLRELWDFMRAHRIWWIAPIVTCLVGIGVLLLLGSTGLAPFIYTLF